MRLLPLVLLLLIASCLEKNPGTNILTAGIFNQALYSINGKDASGKTIDLGEHLLTNPPIVLEVKVFNGTNYPYTEIDLEFTAAGENSSAVNYLPTPEGAVEFPGKDGTCNRVLLPKKTCSIFLEINPREERIFNEFIKLSYKQYVELEEHIATVTFLAGMPASLVFTNEKTQYAFGTPAGPNANPVVERADAEPHMEELEIKNVGGLTARDIILGLDETCTSSLSNDCPAGMFGAYRYEHNCPTNLAPGETCQLKVFYQPLNKNPASGPTPDAIKEINYRATLTARYVTDSNGKQAALNAYFNSVSTDIQARFTTTNSSVIFDQEIIAGNRDTRFITVRNVGYRSGFLNSFSIHDQDNDLIADCFKTDDGAFLQCVDTSSTPVPLSTLPFRLKDRNGCLSTPDNKIEIDVGRSCSFDIYFQPSVTFLTEKLSEFQGLQIYSTYDAFWKNQETIIKTRFSTLNAKSITAARIIIEKILYDGEEVYNSSMGTPSLADLGRITLQAQSFAVAKSLIISFKNIGQTRATNTSIRDGLNRAIPIGGSGVSLGVTAPHYYRQVIASDSLCNFIEPNSTCTMSMNFAAVGLGSTAEEDNNMFDSTDDLSRRIKQFILNYKSGALYTDENIDGSPDYPNQDSEARLAAHLVRKGMLMELTDDSRNVPEFGGAAASINDEALTYIYLRNIGTGDVSYIQALNVPTTSGTNQSNSWSIIPTPDPLSVGADFDCLSIVDTNLAGNTSGTENPSTRTGYAPLPSGKSCVYTMRIKHSDNLRTYNANDCIANATRTEEATRLFYQGGGEKLWQICRNNSTTRWQNLRFRYYDGDSTAPAPDHPDFGAEFRTKNYTMQYQASWARKLTFTNHAPFLTATVYRPAFTLPALPPLAEKSVPEFWFYGTGTYYFFNENEVLNTSPFVKANQSRHVVQAFPFFTDIKDEYDYIYYAGTFPKNSGTLNFNATLINSGSQGVKIISFTPTYLYGGDMTTTALTPRTVNSGNSQAIAATLNTATADIGPHGIKVEMTLETGEHTVPVIFKSSKTPTNSTQLASNKVTRPMKVLILANVIDTPNHPKLTVDVKDFDVVGNEGAPPTVTAKPIVTVPLSWNLNGLAGTINLESVKIPHVPTVNDVYAKKTLILKNNSTQTIKNLDYKFRSSVTASVITTIASTLNILTTETTCSVGMTLAPGASCNLTYRYQPRTADINYNYVLTFVYSSENNEFFMENLGFNLLPKSPGKLIAVGKTIQTINYKATPSSSAIIRDSYQLPFPTTELTSIPTDINFTANSGSLSKIELENVEETKASLLLAYQKYLAKKNLRGFSEASPPSSSVIPLEAEYQTRSDGQQYVPIYAGTYLSAEASRPCLFGDDENNDAIPSHEKGFNKNTVSSCYLRFTLSANFDYLNRTITNIDADAMRDNAFELWYYSVSRSASAYVWFHLTGTVLPNSSARTGNYEDVEAFDSKVIKLSTPTFSPANHSLGSFRGVRVYLTDTKTNLNNLYLTPPATYFDIRADINGKWYAEFNTGLENGKFYYLKAAAIRYDARFTHTTARFPGLNPGEYISVDSSTPMLTVAVPPAGHYYVHDEKAIVDKQITGTVGNYTWAVADSRCIARTVVLKNPDNKTYRYKLMSFDVWEYIKGIPTAHSYANHLSTAHWLSDPQVIIDDIAMASSQYNPASSSQTLSDIKVFYFRDTANRNAPVNLMVGGVPGTGNSDYTSLITPTLPFANSRCMISLE